MLCPNGETQFAASRTHIFNHSTLKSSYLTYPLRSYLDPFKSYRLAQRGQRILNTTGTAASSDRSKALRPRRTARVGPSEDERHAKVQPLLSMVIGTHRVGVNRLQ